ncbi:nuclear receptor subfamily 1 group I member 2 isoform X2 [Boleophthalmus pectinirostris]|nr:nuclear receptor subfamily 1 group I member 2 isoform X2 [Boleophthalmus pectinirostris]XP_055012315.1 nuclear receptor subfamily 1 group I member 2 isoform X2 [Boleophthalmus pectinirostris]
MKSMNTRLQPFCQNFPIGDENEEESEDEGPKFCGVCGDQAKGYHFNALTCEGCKGFFRRAIKRSTPLHCSFLNKCKITKNNRRACQACRFQKCQAIGMRKEMVMSEEEVLERRIKIKRRKMQTASSQLSDQQEKMIVELLTAHRKTFDLGFSNFRGFRPMDRTIASPNDLNHYTNEPYDPLCSHPTDVSPTAYNLFLPSPPFSSSSSPCSSSSSSSSPSLYLYFDKEQNKESDQKIKFFTSLPHLSDLATYMVHNIIRFSKSLQVFRSLNMEDQITLLKGATLEILQLRFNMVFNVKTCMWECGSISYYKDDVIRAGFQTALVDALVKFHQNLRNLGLQEEEYVIAQGISLFSPDRPGVQQRDLIDQQQESLALMLQTYIDSKRRGPEKHLLFPKVLACLTELRTMTEEYSKQVLQIQDIQPDISPLILEVISKD